MMESFNLVGNVLAIFLTLLVLMYIFGDNVFFRIAIHIFIGLSAGYAAGIAIESVLAPQLLSMYYASDYIGLAVPLLLLGLLGLKLSPSLARLGNPASALLVGVGAAVAVGGAIQGTLLPQMQSAFTLLSGSFSNFINGTIILVGMVTSLIYFNFTVRRRATLPGKRQLIIEIMSRIGQGFIAITLGVVFAGVYSAALSALVERFDFIKMFINGFF